MGEFLKTFSVFDAAAPAATPLSIGVSSNAGLFFLTSTGVEVSYIDGLFFLVPAVKYAPLVGVLKFAEAFDEGVTSPPTFD